jgi:hypothetical protein
MADSNIQPKQSGEMPVFGALVGVLAFSAFTYFIIQWMGSGMTRDY